jgi:hypothetical protein
MDVAVHGYQGSYPTSSLFIHSQVWECIQTLDDVCNVVLGYILGKKRRANLQGLGMPVINTFLNFPKANDMLGKMLNFKRTLCFSFSLHRIWENCCQGAFGFVNRGNIKAMKETGLFLIKASHSILDYIVCDFYRVGFLCPFVRSS